MDEHLSVIKYIIILVFIYSCKSQEKRNSNVIKNNYYTIIFTQRDSVDKTIKPSKTLPPDRSILYYIDNFKLKHYIIDDLIKSDTIKIEAEKDSILIDLTYYQSDFISYLLKKGDSIQVKYQNALPSVKVLNRETYKFDFSCDSLLRKIIKDTIPAIDLLMNLPEKKTSYKQFYKRQKHKTEREQKILDSLFIKKQISESYYKIRKEKSKFDYLNLQLFFSSGKNRDSILIKEEDLSKEELLEYSFYYKFLIQYSYNILNKSRGNYSKLGFNYDYTNIFNQLTKDKTITSKKIKNLLLTRVLKEIKKSCSIQEFNKYYDSYLDIVKDTIIINKFRKENLLEYSNYANQVENTYFVNSRNNLLNLEEVIRKNKGKLIYIDFWASWCIPCRKLMVDSKVLNKKYKKDITFIYISIDDNQNDWITACKEEKISGNNNLLAINYPKSIFYKNLKLNSIPRYVLFDKNGKLIHENAPSPDTKEIIILFDKYLKNKKQNQ